MSTGSNQPNRLLNEKSPYLQQHAYNPVDWYPWGPEAFSKAKHENKPILLSIGYSTCHWCHVMERESFENPDTAALMNQYLVCIKVDREERPDVDKIYMTAVSAMTGSGGWPLNVFLTPDLKPFFGGTYFPPAARWGHPGWPDVVHQIGEAWTKPEEREKMLSAGQHMSETLASIVVQTQPPQEGKPEWLDMAFKHLKSQYDEAYGGFGGAPKFPMPVYHHFLMRYGARTHNEEATELSLHTLREMAKGGIYDHIGGGFSRYSTDERWHIPHFEKMLYDNAQLAVNYTEAYQISHDSELARIARETLDYVRRDMTHREGGFYSAEDADSLPSREEAEKTEGAFYVWEKSEIMSVLGEEAGDIFCFRYGIRDQGNALQDPHSEFTNKNILYVAHPLPEIARHFKTSEDAIRDSLENARKKLFAVRAMRPRPHLDDKIITAWNGLMISAYAKAYQVWENPQDLEMARRAAQFLRVNLFDAEGRCLYRRWREGERNHPGIADDYAFLIQGLLDLYESDFDPAWLAWAEELLEIEIERFYDPLAGGFFMTAVDQDPHLLLRVKEDADNVEPCASSVSALNLLRLAHYTNYTDLREKAEKTLNAFGRTLAQAPTSMPVMLSALDFALQQPQQIVVVGKQQALETQALRRILNRHFLPVKIVIGLEGEAQQKQWAERLPFLAAMKELDGKATVYVCQNFACRQPTSDPVVFETVLLK